LNVFDTERLVPLAEVRIPYAQATWSLAVAPEPSAPLNLSAIVAASQVTLTWQSGPRSPAISHFEIEAGSAPGAADLARLRSDDASFSLVVADVPPGRYYVRVRASNYGGTSEPSNEILVTVP
jgi:hypothetical protein